MESLYKNFQLMLEFLKAPFLVLHFAYYTLMTYYTLLCINYALLLSMLMILIFYSKCDQASDLWQQLELASELESDLGDTGLGQEVACRFQCWENSTGFV